MRLKLTGKFMGMDVSKVSGMGREGEDVEKKEDEDEYRYKQLLFSCFVFRATVKVSQRNSNNCRNFNYENNKSTLTCFALK